MREGISGADITLLLGGGKQFYRVRVKRWDDAAWTNLSALAGGDWVLSIRSDGESPDQPASRFTFSLLHSAGGSSLAPGISASPHNIDATLAFRPLIHPGRDVEISIAVLASGTPSAGDWKPWLRGQIEDVDWPTAEVVASCLTPDGVLLQRQIEIGGQRGSDADPPAVEDEIQGLLDAVMGVGVVPLRVIGTPGWLVGLYPDSGELGGSLGEQVRALAQANGWDIRYRWSSADADFVLTLYEPPRDKTTPDLTLTAAQVIDVPGLQESRKYVRNAFRVSYLDAATGTRQILNTQNDASIEEYGRQFMSLVEDDGSPVDSDARASALLGFADNDLAWPLADGRFAVPFLPWLELGDLIEIEADDQHYDFDTSFAVVAAAHEVTGETGSSSTFEGRGGTPVGMRIGWFRRRRMSLRDRIAAVENDPRSGIELEKIYSDDLSIRYRIIWGSDVDHVRLWNREYEQPVDGVQVEPAADAVDWDDVLLPDTDDEIEFALPMPGRERWVTLRPITAAGAIGHGFHFPIPPTTEAADRIISIGVDVRHEDGSVEIPLTIDGRAQSVRGAYNVGPPGVVAPSDADVEASGGAATGGFVANMIGSDVIGLPAGTVDYDEEIAVRAAAYLGRDGVDDKGRAYVHGEVQEARDIRQKPPVSLELTTVDDDDPATGTAGVTLRDEVGFTTAIKARRKIGDTEWSAPFTVISSPVNGTEYLVTVTKVERHHSQLEIWAEGLINGASFQVYVEVPGFDVGKVPNVIVVPKLDEDAATGSGTIIGDADTYSTKVVAKRNSVPSEAEVNAATPIVGRSLPYTSVGTLVSGLEPGDLVHYAWKGIGPNGEIQSAVNRTTVPYLVIAPSLDTTATSENQSTAVATFGVTVRDTAAQADLLEFQTRENGNPWPASWTTKSSSPADATQYSETVPMKEDHVSQIRFRLKYTIRGKVREIIVESPAFDLGKVPRITIQGIVRENLQVTAVVPVDFDTLSVKIAAAVGSMPSDATVRGATAINVPGGQTALTTANVGTLLTASPSDTVFLKAFGYSATGGGGTESPQPAVDEIVVGTPPRVEADVTLNTTNVAFTARAKLGTTTTGDLEYRDPGGSWTSAASSSYTSTRSRPGIGANPTWVEFRAKINNQYSDPLRVEVPSQIAPALLFLSATVDDDGTNNTYDVDWTVSAGVNAIDHDLKLDLYEYGGTIHPETVADPTGLSFANGYADGNGISDLHRVEASLVTAGGDVLNSLLVSVMST